MSRAQRCAATSERAIYASGKNAPLHSWLNARQLCRPLVAAAAVGMVACSSHNHDPGPRPPAQVTFGPTTESSWAIHIFADSQRNPTRIDVPPLTNLPAGSARTSSQPGARWQSLSGSAKPSPVPLARVDTPDGG